MKKTISNKKTVWSKCPQCGISFGTIFPRDDGLCIPCSRNNELVLFKRTVTDGADKIIEEHGNLDWLHWDNEDLVNFAEDVLSLFYRSELILEE
jgi:hypothetical protein